MIRKLYAFGRILAVTVLLGGAASAAHAQNKPLTDADVAEGQALIDNYVMPLMTDIDAVLKLAATDTSRACTLARANEAKALELEARVTALHSRLVSEGKTTEGFDQILQGAEQMKTGTHDSARGLCSGALAKTGNAEHDAAVQKMIALSSNFTAATNASIKADNDGDHAGACLHLREAYGAYNDLMAYLKELRAKMVPGSKDAVEMDAAIAKAAPLKGQMADELKDCPAA